MAVLAMRVSTGARVGWIEPPDPVAQSILHHSHSHLDHDLPVLDEGRIGFRRNHARRQHHFAGADVELAVMEIALDYVTLDITLRERPRTMGAQIVERVKFAVDVKDRHAQPFLLDLEGGADRNVVGIAALRQTLSRSSLTPAESRGTLAEPKTRRFARVCSRRHRP